MYMGPIREFQGNLQPTILNTGFG